MHVRNLRVSDVGIRLYSPDARMGAVIDDRMSAYLDEEDGPTDFNVRLDPGAESVTTQGRVHDVRRLEAGRLQLERDGRLAAVVDFATGLGHAHLVPDRWGMDSLVRLLLAAHLPQIGGTLVHAAGTVFEGCGIVIPGVSGAGKSTLLAHIGGDPVLSDEIVAVRLDDS